MVYPNHMHIFKSMVKTSSLRTQGTHYLFTLSRIKTREITFIEWAPRPLILPKRKKYEPSYFSYINHIPNKILPLTVPDRVLSINHALHGQTKTFPLLCSWGIKMPQIITLRNSGSGTFFHLFSSRSSFPKKPL